MSAPKRLLDSDPNSHLAAVLRAGLTEQAPAELPHHILAGLRAGAAANAAAGLAAAGTLAAGSAPTAAVALVVAKWLTVGMVSAGLIGAGASAWYPPGPSVSSRATSATVSVAPVLPNALSEQDPKLPAQGGSTPPEPSGTATSATTTSAHVTQGLNSDHVDPSFADPAAAGQLGGEVRLIDAARRALAAGDAGSALQKLSEYRAIAVTGVLEREARVLRIESLLKLGDVQQAEQLGRAYLRALPGDAHAPRLRALLHLESTPSGSKGSLGDMNHGRSSVP